MTQKPKHHHSDRDKIYTPYMVVKEVLQNIPHERGDTWCDPCFGKGVFYDNFPCPEEDKTWFEIDLGKDYFSNTEKFDWVVTNIPFSKPKEFIFKMATDCKKGMGILCLANSMTATRLLRLSDEFGLHIHHMAVLYIKDWGFGYRTDFYILTKERHPSFNVMRYETHKKE